MFSLEVMVGKELEEQLMEAGTKLLKIPESSDELLALLDQVEASLTRVEQSPSASMREALSPSLKALVTTDLFRHVNADVRASVASCVSEITRITAPEAPYTDDKMKQIFQLIVGSFEMLHDIDSRSYQKRVSILETVAEVRSCVVMLDLECDSLILEMFQHFLTSARDEHPINVISFMETIMTLVLVESEEITPELLHPLLTTVEKDNQGVLTVRRKLAERVLENCRSKLQPCLLNAVKSMGMSPNDFTKVVASICQEISDTTENDDSVSGEHVGDERNLPEKMGSNKLQQVTEELKSEIACPEEVDVVSEKSSTKRPSSRSSGSVIDFDGPGSTKHLTAFGGNVRLPDAPDAPHASTKVVSPTPPRAAPTPPTPEEIADAANSDFYRPIFADAANSDFYRPTFADAKGRRVTWGDRGLDSPAVSYGIMKNVSVPLDLEKCLAMNSDIQASCFYRHAYGTFFHGKVLAEKVPDLEKKVAQLRKLADGYKADYTATNAERNRLQDQLLNVDHKVTTALNQEVEADKKRAAAELKVKELEKAVTAERKKAVAAVAKATESEELVGQLKNEVEILKQANGEMFVAMSTY